MTKRLALPIATVLLLGAAPLSVASEGTSAETEAVWSHHVERAAAGDLDGIMKDFGDDSVIITPAGVLAGKPAIRGFFQDFLAHLDEAAMKSLVVNSETFHDDVVVSNFTIGSTHQTFQDTAIVTNDRIRVLSTVAYPAE